MSALLAAFHFIGILLTYGGGLLRIHALRESLNTKDTTFILKADNLYGFGFLLVLTTGLLRAFGGFEKGTEFYLQSSSFWIKMVIIFIILLLEIGPIIYFVRWRIKRKLTYLDSELPMIRKILMLSKIEAALILLLPIIASLMARGITLF